MIRLGSLAGYPFEGPRLLAGWTPPAGAAVYAILYKPDPDTKPERYAVIFAGHCDDLAAERFPFGHPRADCWVRRAGSRWRVYIATYQIPGGGRGHREQITRELAAIYQPQCNADRYGQSWKREWIGEYTAPTTGPLARRGPGGGPAEGNGGAAGGPAEGNGGAAGGPAEGNGGPGGGHREAGAAPGPGPANAGGGPGQVDRGHGDQGRDSGPDEDTRP